MARENARSRCVSLDRWRYVWSVVFDFFHCYASRVKLVKASPRFGELWRSHVSGDDETTCTLTVRDTLRDLKTDADFTVLVLPLSRAKHRASLSFDVLKRTVVTELNLDVFISARDASILTSSRKVDDVHGVLNLAAVRCFLVDAAEARCEAWAVLKPSQAEKAAYIHACTVQSVLPLLEVNDRMLLLKNVGALPLAVVSHRIKDWELALANAKIALSKLHDAGIIHGNVNEDTLWFHPETYQAWLFGLERSVIDGHGWNEFHERRWGRLRSPTIDDQALLKTVMRLRKAR